MEMETTIDNEKYFKWISVKKEHTHLIMLEFLENNTPFTVGKYVKYETKCKWKVGNREITILVRNSHNNLFIDGRFIAVIDQVEHFSNAKLIYSNILKYIKKEDVSLYNLLTLIQNTNAYTKKQKQKKRSSNSKISP